MKPKGGSYQTTTEVKVLSPEICNNAEVDLFKQKEDNTKFIEKGEIKVVLPGSKSVV